MKRDMFSLEGKTALVAGGAGDIGGACAEAFADYGARIVIFDFDREALERKLDDWKKKGIEAEGYWGDITDEAFLCNMVREVEARYGGIDIALNNIAVTNRKPMLDFTTEEWLRVININLNGSYFFLREVGRVMCRQNHGKVIQILSTGAYRFGANFSAYGASKAGVSALIKCLAVEWAPHNVQLNGIAPTATDTGFTREYYRQYPERMQATINNHPYKRLGKPEDYVGAAIYLASGAADFVNGEVIVVDSGKTVK